MKRDKHILAEWLATALENSGPECLVWPENIRRVTMDGHFDLVIVAQ